MNLDEAKKQTVAAWIAEGLKLSEIQKRLESELGIKMTYMEVRFLLDDLKVIPKDPIPAPPPKPIGPAQSAKNEAAAELEDSDALEDELPGPEMESGPGSGNVKVTLDKITKPGSVVSGSVTFSDGKQAGWSLDQFGRLGMAPAEKGYRPPPADVQEFQLALQSELAKLGY
jgi:hypothetical protein